MVHLYAEPVAAIVTFWCAAADVGPLPVASAARLRAGHDAGCAECVAYGGARLTPA